MRLYFKYIFKKTKRVIIPPVFCLTFLMSLFLSFAYLTNLPYSKVLSLVPEFVKTAAHGTVNQFNSWKISLADLPYFLNRFKTSELPVYDLVIDEDKLDELDNYFLSGQASSDGKDFKTAKFFADGKEYDVRVTYRGDEDIHYAFEKKSWRIKFPKDNLFGSMKSVNFIIPEDRLFIAEYFDNYRASKMGVPVPKSRFSVLRINGRSQGVYFEIEQWGGKMLEKNKLSPDANLYGEQGVGGDIYNDISLWQKYSENPHQSPQDFSELSVLLELLNNPSDEYFWKNIPTILDMQEFFNWQAHSVLSGSTHQDYVHNARLYFNPGSGKFMFLPWDVYMTPVQDSMIDGQGIDFIDYNPLVQRILKNPEYLFERNKLIWNYVKDDSHLKDDLAFYDSTLTQIKTAFFQDTKKLYTNNFFLDSVREARSIIEKNYLFLRDIISSGDIKVNQTINIDSSKNKISFSAIPMELEINFKSLVPQDLVSIEINNVSPTLGSGRISIYYDSNGNGILDLSDKFLWNGSLNGGKMLKAEGLKLRLYSQMVTVEDVDNLLGRTLIKPSVNRIFILGLNSKTLSEQTKITFENPITFGKTTVLSDAHLRNDGLLNYLNDVNISRDEFINKYFYFARTGLGNEIVIGPGFYNISGVVVIPRGIRVVIMPGTTLSFSKDSSILSYSPFTADGSSEFPIVFKPADNSSSWGSLMIVGAKDKSSFSFTEFIGGSGAYINGIFTRASLSLHNSPGEVFDSMFKGNFGDDALHFENTEAIVKQNIFDSNAFDAIDLDFVTGEVVGNVFMKTGNDGVDLSGSKVVVKDNFISGSGDKGISVGEKSSPDIINNLIINGNIGIAVKDLSNAFIFETTIYNNNSGLDLYTKKGIFGGGNASVVNSIIWGNKEEVGIDKDSQLTISFSNIEGGWAGDNNLSIEPKFDSSKECCYLIASESNNTILAENGLKGEQKGVLDQIYYGVGRIGSAVFR